MRYVIFSDVHGNKYALEKLLAGESSGDDTRFIFCGDVCGYYYHALECVELLEGIPFLVSVLGNHDRYFLDSYGDPRLAARLSAKYGTAYLCRDRAIVDYLCKVPVSETLEDGRLTIHIHHGTPVDALGGRVYPDAGDGEVLAACGLGEGFCAPTTVFVSGHTHYRMARRIGNIVWINPGSLGQPRDGQGFSYAVLDGVSMEVSFHTLEVDVKELLAEIEEREPNNTYLRDVLLRSR